MATRGIQTLISPRLHIYVVCAKALKAVGLLKMSPYCTASQEGGTIERTEPCKKGHTDPTFHQLIHLDLLSIDKTVQISMMSGSTLIGTASIHPNSIKVRVLFSGTDRPRSFRPSFLKRVMVLLSQRIRSHNTGWTAQLWRITYQKKG